MPAPTFYPSIFVIPLGQDYKFSILGLKRLIHKLSRVEDLLSLVFPNETCIFTGRNEVLAKVIFLHLFVILFTGGGVPDQVHPPGTRYTPPGTRYTPPDQVHPPGTRYTPPRDQVHPPLGPGTSPPGPGTPPRTRYTPPDQVHPPPGTRYTPPDQVHPPRPGTPPSRDQVHPPRTRYPPQTRYTPQDQVHPPGTRYTPPGPGIPPPPGPGTPPGTRYTPPGTRYPPGPGTPPSPPGCKLRNTVNDRPVRILLECILVNEIKRSLVSFLILQKEYLMNIFVTMKHYRSTQKKSTGIIKGQKEARQKIVM